MFLDEIDSMIKSKKPAISCKSNKNLVYKAIAPPAHPQKMTNLTLPMSHIMSTPLHLLYYRSPFLKKKRG